MPYGGVSYRRDKLIRQHGVHFLARRRLVRQRSHRTISDSEWPGIHLVAKASEQTKNSFLFFSVA